MKVATKSYAQALYETVKELKGEPLKSAVKNFVKLLARRNLLSFTPQIISDFKTYFNQAEKIIEVKVAAAQALTETQKEIIKNQIKDLTGKTADLILETDPELIGGVKIAFADNLIDGSFKKQLADFKQQLLTRN